MPLSRTYPKLGLRSKTEIARRLSGKNLTREQILVLLNDALKNHEELWKDSKRHSKPLENKFVRDAKGTSLGTLLSEIDEKILAVNDHLLPGFVFGKKGANYVDAALQLLGTKRKRVYLKQDVSTFFENISYQRVYDFFLIKTKCKPEAASILATLCCVPKGRKGSGSNEMILARGFATSSRLAAWTNRDTFNAVNNHVYKALQGHNPRFIVYVDDLGVSASRVTEEKMHSLADEIATILQTHDHNQPLPEKRGKRKVKAYNKHPEILGAELTKNGLKISHKTRLNIANAKAAVRKDPSNTKEFVRLKSLQRHKSYLEKKASSR